MKKQDKILLAIGGIIVFVFLPRDSWSFDMFIYLFFCTFLGSSISYFFISNFFKSLIVSIIIGACLFFIGLFIIDVKFEVDRQKIIAEYIMWFPLMILNCLLYAGSVTAFIFPLVESLFGLWEGKRK